VSGRPEVVVVGAGRMGRGLAHVFAYAGHPVTLVDLKPRRAGERERLTAAVFADLRRSLGALADHGVMPAQAVTRIVERVGLADVATAETALAGADFVFEAVPEVIDAKRAALAAIGRLARADAVVASTTSTILVDELAAHIEGPERFLNAHWLNPAYLIPLVEISPGQATSTAVVAALEALLESVGKVTVVCAASPGTIVPRLQALAMNEAARLVEEGVASAEAIDKATRYGFGFRFAILGVVEFIDWGGGDILYYADEHLRRSLGAERFSAPEVVRRNMESGAIGLKAGRGFHDYAGRDLDAYQRATIARFLDLLGHYGLLRPPAED
jgi:3-hydroxybutyryl-CoA dehydrogenase